MLHQPKSVYKSSNSGGKTTFPCMSLRLFGKSSIAINASSGAGNGDLISHFEAGLKPNFG
jgi:hypothetical protein